VECSNCGERARVEAPVPDVRARVAAIELLLREGLGRPPHAEEPRVSRIPESTEAIKQMSWDDIATVATPQALHVNRRDLLGGLIHEYELAAA
jgi:hypothetical protein